VVELVAPTVADAGRIAELVNARSQALEGANEESTESVARWFAIPDLAPAADMRLAVARGGTVLGYADVSAPEDGTPRAAVDLRVRASAPEALALLFAWTEQRAAERAGPGGVIHYFVDEQELAVRDVLVAAGYAIVRGTYVMVRPLGPHLEPPVWPDAIEVRPFDEEYARALAVAHEEAFSDHWGHTSWTYEAWRAYNLGEGEDTALWRIAWDGDEIAGLCLNAPRRGDDDATGWIKVLGVRRPWRRRGLGEALLRDAFVTFAARGKQEAGLGVDAENTTNAVALYERVGMDVVRRSDTWERIVA
jgi:mycothiol synthase